MFLEGRLPEFLKEKVARFVPSARHVGFSTLQEVTKISHGEELMEIRRLARFVEDTTLECERQPRDMKSPVARGAGPNPGHGVNWHC